MLGAYRQKGERRGGSRGGQGGERMGGQGGERMGGQGGEGGRGRPRGPRPCPEETTGGVSSCTCKDGTSVTTPRDCGRDNKPTHCTCADGSSFTPPERGSQSEPSLGAMFGDGSQSEPSLGASMLGAYRQKGERRGGFRGGQGGERMGGQGGERMGGQGGEGGRGRPRGPRPCPEETTGGVSSCTCKDGTSVTTPRDCGRDNKPTQCTCADGSSFTPPERGSQSEPSIGASMFGEYRSKGERRGGSRGGQGGERMGGQGGERMGGQGGEGGRRRPRGPR